MITVFVDNCNPISQVFYDKTISSLPFHQLSCSCLHSGSLTRHGFYHRLLKDGDAAVSLKICRVLCSVCGRTHALLLSNMVPYSQISLSDQIDIISDSLHGRISHDVMQRTLLIDENNLRYVIRQYLRHWHQRLLSIKASLTSSSLSFLCFAQFGRQFMQNKKGSNLLFLIPT